MRSRAPFLVVASAVVIGGLVLLVACRPDPRKTSPAPQPVSFLEIQRGNLVYTYHLATRSEALFEASSDPDRLANIIRERPEDARKLRLILEDELDVSSLDEIDDAREIEDALRGLGYI